MADDATQQGSGSSGNNGGEPEVTFEPETGSPVPEDTELDSEGKEDEQQANPE